jgi:lysozyme
LVRGSGDSHRREETGVIVPDELGRLVKACEGFRPTPYLCPAGHWTIGYGTLCQPNHPAITREDADAILNTALTSYVGHALRLSPVLSTTSVGKLVAVTDFLYNLGPTRYAASRFRRAVDAQNWPVAASECQRWVFGGGRRLPGLEARRDVEARLLNP